MRALAAFVFLIGGALSALGQNVGSSNEQQSPWPFIIFALIGLIILAKVVSYLNRRNNLIKKYGRETALLLLARKVWQGMSAEQLRDSWGAPVDIDHTVYKTKTKETWKYNQTGKNRFKDRIFVEDGIVVGWKD